MPNTRELVSTYIGAFSSIEAVNESPTQGSPWGTNVGIHPAELGKCVFVSPQGGGAAAAYQKVQLDSGATSASTAGAVTAGELAYCKNKASYIVTNDSRFAVGGQTTTGWQNEVAGVFTNAVTAGNNTFVKQRGNFATVKIASGSPNIGDWLISDTSTTGAQGKVIAANSSAGATSLPAIQPLGKFAASGSSVTSGSVDLDIPQIP